MLHELRIENLLLIDRAELRFGPGLNVITGETGAGKTILAHAVDLLMGGRPRPHIVRPGAGEAYVEGVFSCPPGLLDDPDLRDLAERLPEDAEEIVLGRRVGASGRTSAFVGGRAASAADLRALGSRLLAFYGQHEHRKLTLAAAQMEVLDGFGGREQLALRSRYRDAHDEVTATARALEVIHERDGARERDLDLLRYELAEIEAAAPEPAEEAELESERDRLRHAEGLRDAAGQALGALAGSEPDAEDAAAAGLAVAQASLQSRAGLDQELDAIGERVSALALEVGDLAAELRGYVDGLEADPARLEALEERLDVFDRLRRKHGGSIEAVLEHAERCRGEIERLEGAEERSAELEARLGTATAERARLGGELSERRARLARELERHVEAELAELAMDGATLQVILQPLAGSDGRGNGFAAGGREAVELRLATNPGLPVAPLRDAASGGELSRVMLALSGLGAGAAAPTLVFDEVDAGIGGQTARAVGERLRRLATGQRDGAAKQKPSRGAEAQARQVVCITHLPQVAALADVHFRIHKATAGGQATAQVSRVEGDELVAEICRMLGADHGDTAASRHARQLLAA